MSTKVAYCKESCEQGLCLGCGHGKYQPDRGMFHCLMCGLGMTTRYAERRMLFIISNLLSAGPTSSFATRTAVPSARTEWSWTSSGVPCAVGSFRN